VFFNQRAYIVVLAVNVELVVIFTPLADAGVVYQASNVYVSLPVASRFGTGRLASLPFVAVASWGLTVPPRGSNVIVMAAGVVGVDGVDVVVGVVVG
jgi:hypothetical protein